MRRRIAVTLLVLMLAGGAMGCSRGAADTAAEDPGAERGAPEAGEAPSAGETPDEKGGLTAAQRLEVFDALWQTVSERNVQLEQKRIDWERVKREFRGPVEQATDLAAFETLLRKVVSRLKDGHAYLDFPMDERRQTAIQTMMDGTRIVIRSVAPGSDAERAGLKAAMEITYVDGEPAAKVWEAKRQLLSDSTEYRNRWNAARTILWGLPGTSVAVVAAGSHQNGLRIANYLSPEPTVWGYGNDREAGLVREFITQPAAVTYGGPVIALTDPSCFSACDLFPAYLQQSGRGKVVGEPPSGATFEATEYPLPHGYTLHLRQGFAGTRPGAAGGEPGSA